MTGETVFLAALDIPDPAERAKHLDAACAGDPALRRRVEELLAAHAASGEFLDVPVGEQGGGGFGTTVPPAGAGGAAAGVTATLPWAGGGRGGEAAGAVVGGRYKLVEPIGEGGMGAVWMAEQTEPVRRLVAVKLVKAGMESRAVLARFDAERQALALMDHPNIARILDGGLHDGCPFFVMELVKGVPITQFCDERQLTPRQRLELFVPVCRALQHAHQKGVIHRDVKPSNVLVALYDDRPVPKVIDFGVAKAVGQQLTDLTLHTGFGAVVGTPAYMAPEQATLNNLDVDTRADVYGLGALLYELLAGAPPFDRATLLRAGLLEMLRVVREVDPPRPSTRVSTGEGRPSVAAARGTEPGVLGRLLRADLDWVVMKALSKDRGRRYDTAAGLAADVERHLAGEPVLAAPPSLAYRLRKLLRRRRAEAAVAGVLAFTAAVGVAAFVWTQAEAARKAREAAEKERRAADHARVLTDKLLLLLGSADPATGDGPSYTVLQLLDEQSPRLWAGLDSQPDVAADLRAVIGRTYLNLVSRDKALDHLKEAERLRREADPPDPVKLAAVLLDLASAHRNDTFDRAASAAERREGGVRALACVREAIALLRQKGDEPPELAAHAQLDYAGTLLRQAVLQPPAERNVRSFQAALREGRALANRCPPGPDRDRWLTEANQLEAGCLREIQDQPLAAVELLRAVLDYRIADRGPDHLSTAFCRLMIAGCYLDADDHQQAEGHIRRALATHARVFPGGGDGYSAHASRQLLVALAWQYKDADVAALLPTRAAGERAADYPAGWAEWASHTWGWVCLQRGDYADAERHIRDALAAGKGQPAAGRLEASSRVVLARTFAFQERWADAARVLDEAGWLAAARSVAAGNPPPAVPLPDDRDPLDFYAEVLLLAGPTDPKDAGRAAALLARRRADPACPDADKAGWLRALDGYAHVLKGEDGPAVEALKAVLADNPGWEWHTRRQVERVLTAALERRNQPREAERVRREAVDHAVSSHPKRPEVAAEQVLLAEAQARHGKHADAAQQLEGAFGLLAAHPQAGEASLVRRRADAAGRLAEVYAGWAGHDKEARQWLAKRDELRPSK